MGIEGEHIDGKSDGNKKWVERMLENRNPHTETDQQDLLQRLSVVHTSALPTDIQRASREHTTTVGTHTKRLADGTQLRITTFPNGILDIQHMKKRKRRVLSYRTYDLVSNYIVDSVSQYAFDVTQLWKDVQGTDERHLEVLVVPDIQEIALAPTKDGDIILLGAYKPSHKMSAEYIDHLKRTAPFHETAHHMQSMLRANEGSLNQMLLKHKFPFLYNWKLLMSLLVSKPNPEEKQARAQLRVQARMHRMWEERNAHAFTLSLVRRLRTLGVDIFRGMSASDIIQKEDEMLQTYDKSKWLSTDRPLAAVASQRDRRLHRGMDKTYHS